MKPIADSIEFPAEIVGSEFLGHETLVFFTVAGAAGTDHFIARLPGRYAPEQKRVFFFLDTGALYFFGDDGRAVS